MTCCRVACVRPRAPGAGRRYDMPWMLHNIVPFRLLGGSPRHEMHHRCGTRCVESRRAPRARLMCSSAHNCHVRACPPRPPPLRYFQQFFTYLDDWWAGGAPSREPFEQCPSWASLPSTTAGRPAASTPSHARANGACSVPGASHCRHAKHEVSECAVSQSDRARGCEGAGPGRAECRAQKRASVAAAHSASGL